MTGHLVNISVENIDTCFLFYELNDFHSSLFFLINNSFCNLQTLMLNSPVSEGFVERLKITV